MELFIAGLIFGALGCRFLGRILGGRRSFNWFFQKELGAERLPAAGEALERIASLEERLNKLSGIWRPLYRQRRAEDCSRHRRADQRSISRRKGLRRKTTGVNRRAARVTWCPLAGGRKLMILPPGPASAGEVELIISLQEK